MSRHIVVFIYIFGIFMGMTGILLYWLMSKKKVLKDRVKDGAGYIRLRKFMISTFFIGLISFFTFYGQYIIFLRPANTTFRILDYLFWVCFIFYWIEYLDSMVDGVYLHKIKEVIKYGCVVYVLIWLFTTSQIWHTDFLIVSLSSKMLFVLLDILFCLLSLFVVVIYVIRGRRQIQNRLSSLYIFAVSFALTVYAVWEFMHYIRLFTGMDKPEAWELNPVNATAFFLFFTNLITLIYVYHNDFAARFLAVQPIGEPEEIPGPAECPEPADIPNSPKDAEPAIPDAPECADTDIALEHNLTPREREVMEFVRKGFSNAEIAGELYISQNTVKHHIYNLFKKLEVKNRVELICLLQEHDPTA